MREEEKRICDNILRYGTIVSDKEYVIDGKPVRQYVIDHSGQEYHLTKESGEWIYIHHVIK